MKLQQPLTVSVNEIVELIFNVNHMPFRARGKVRVIRSKSLVGFQFPQLSERARLQIEDLIDELIGCQEKLHPQSSAVHHSGAQVSKARGESACHPIKPAGGRNVDAIDSAPKRRRWF
jgi:hypothetical protein